MKKIRLAISGVGAISYVHAHGMERIDNAELVAICDIHREQLDKFRKVFSVDEKNCYTDFDEMLKRDDIDAVIICTPDNDHKDTSIKALKAGKHVLCEKPMALRLDECRDMVKATKETNKKFMIGQVCRKAPGFIKAKELVDSGIIGDIFFIESEYAHDYMNSPGIDNWRKSPDRHPIIGGGCHAVDLLRWISGDPTEVFAYANHKMLPDWPVNDCVVSVLKFPNNIIGKVMTSIGCKRSYTMRTVIYGSKGTIITDNTSNTISLFKDKISDEMDKIGYADNMEIKIPVAVNSHNMTDEIKDFIFCIQNNTEPNPDCTQGFITVAVCDAIVRSAETGDKIVIDYTC